ncbi:MAG: hypothetical protein ACRDZQ_04250 [Acidimicrobiales bacterium]
MTMPIITAPLPTKGQLQAKLLTLSQMPAGFIHAVVGAGSGTSAGSCPTSARPGNRGVKVYEAFAKSTVGPIAIEALGVAPSVAQAKEVFRDLQVSLPTCVRAAHIAPMSLPALGEQRYAAVLKGISVPAGFSARMDVAIVRTDRTLVVMVEIGITPNNAQQFALLTEAAVAKVESLL